MEMISSCATRSDRLEGLYFSTHGRELKASGVGAGATAAPVEALALPLPFPLPHYYI